MVVKLMSSTYQQYLGFENGVILYGGKTIYIKRYLSFMFENGVILYGGKTCVSLYPKALLFENGVILYGGKTG